MNAPLHRERVARAPLRGVPRGRWRWLAPLALAAALLVPAVRARAANTKAGELELRGVYVYNFVRFTEWPAGTFASSSAPLTLSVIGDPDLGLTLQRLLAGKSLDSHPIVVNIAADAPACASSQAVFIGSSRQKDVGSVLTAVGDHPVLTMSDVPSFVRQGGMIRIFTSDQRLRFEVNARAAGQSKLVISSRLLQLAENVVRR